LKEIFGNQTGLDDRSYKSLLSALEKANLPGFDYLEFKQSLEAMAKMGMDESTAIKSAFMTASTMGLTKEKLLTTARHYKSILAKELIQFDRACESQIEKRVNGKMREVDKLKKQIDLHLAEIAKLEKQITDYQGVISSADADMKEASEKINATKDSFDRTFHSVMNQIEKDISIIDQIL